MKSRIVEIRPIERKKWHGKKGQENFSAPVKIPAQRDIESYTYKTGLDYKNLNFEHPVTKEKITEADYYGHILKVDLSPNILKDKPHPFWDSHSATLQLKNTTTLLNIDNNPLDYIKYKVALAHDRIANSEKELDEGLYENATHYIYDEDISVETELKNIELKEDAILEVRKLSSEKRLQVLLVISGINHQDKSDDFIKLELRKEIEKNPEKVLRYCNYDKEDLALEALVVKGIMKNVLIKDGHKIKYYDYVLGTGTSGNYDEVIKYLKEPENNALKIKLIEQINS